MASFYVKLDADESTDAPVVVGSEQWEELVTDETLLWTDHLPECARFSLISASVSSLVSPVKDRRQRPSRCSPGGLCHHRGRRTISQIWSRTRRAAFGPAGRRSSRRGAP
jgi:hypothetical protein